MIYKWIPFNENSTPVERRAVLLQIDGDGNTGTSPSVVIGYLRIHSDGPFFVIPGIARNGRKVTHWCDCLGDDFFAPLWHGTPFARPIHPPSSPYALLLITH